MPLTVEQVAALPDLGLIVRTSSAPVDRAVRWVAVSELPDPTPWLEPGVLLLTTGMPVDADARRCRAYVDRLVAAEVAALGFGVGLGHESVPAALLRAAERSGLPVVEVPAPVPFVAVSKAVTRLLAEEEYAEAEAAFDCQRRMIRAALADGSDAAVLRSVAKHLSGFALHLDSEGAVVGAHPASAASRAAHLAGEVERLRQRGLLASASVATAEEHIAIVPIGVRGSADGFFVAGSQRPMRPADQSVLNLAGSLLSWQAMRPLAHDESMDGWRSLLVDAAGQFGLPVSGLERVAPGMDPRRACAVVVRGGAQADRAVAAVHAAGRALLARAGDGYRGIAAAGEDSRPARAIVELAHAPGVESVGVSDPADLTEAANAARALGQAAAAARSGPGLRLYGERPDRGFGSLVDAAAARSWARDYLAGLGSSSESAELIQTLQAWLAHHGQVDAAAQELGVHRHTVRHRLRRAEACLGRSLDEPSVRADLWFALSAQSEARDRFEP